MSKILWKPSTMLNPVPLVMVSCSDGKGKSNIITLAWAGTVNSEPPMLSISIRPERFSYDMIKNSGEFVVNLVNDKLVKAADYCGVKSGRDIDKFSELRLTARQATKVNVPIIEESPVNIECKVIKIIKLGSHDMFLGEILAVNIDENLINAKGKLEMEKAKPTVFSHGEYWGLNRSLGFFGFSVASPKILKRKKAQKK
jgi:flavin reductase (DIM6/NTAB) family NADH-FMN oxidoreductase RutF